MYLNQRSLAPRNAQKYERGLAVFNNCMINIILYHMLDNI